MEGRTMDRTPVLTGELDVGRPDAYADRTNFWRRLRHEAPVAFSPTINMWVVSSYNEVLDVVRDTTRFGKQQRRPPIVELTDEAAAVYAEYQHEYIPTFENNPPLHSMYRQKVLPAVSAPKMEARRPIIERLANELIDEFESSGQADVIDAYGFPLPALHGFDMIGVPTEDMLLVRRLSIASIDIQLGFPKPDEQVAIAKDAVAYWRYLVDLVEMHRKSQSNDLVNDLINATTGPDNRPLTTPEVASLLSNLVRGAHRTTSNLIGNTLHALLSRPELWRRVVADPSLARAAIDESLRINAPAPGLPYIAMVDTELGGVPIKAGDQLYPVFASANHDENRFPDAGVFDIDREENRQNLTFGAGPHLCPGKALGRITGTAAVQTFVERLPNSRLLDPTAYWIPSVTTQGLVRLDVAWDV